MSCECKICGKNFISYTALASHTKWKHGPRNKFECPTCHKKFRDSFGVNRHKAKVHSPSHVEHPRSCPLCDFSAPKNSMLIHFKDDHDVRLLEETLTFDSMDDFLCWKKSMELASGSKFVKHRASKKLKGGIVSTMYYCFRDGQFKSNSRGLRSLKKFKSIKMNAHCPASLQVWETNDQVTVLFIKTHVGHLNEVAKPDIEASEEDCTVDGVHPSPLQGELVDGTLVVYKDLKVSIEASGEDCTVDGVHPSPLKGEPVDGTLVVYKDLQVGNNDEITTTISEENDQIESASTDMVENIACVIELPDISSDENFIQRKQEEIGKLIEILDSIKTDAGLSVFQQHVAPLKSIVEEAERKWSRVISVRILKQNPTKEPSSNENITLEAEDISNIRIITTTSLSEPSNSQEMQLVAETIPCNSEQLVINESHS